LTQRPPGEDEAVPSIPATYLNAFLYCPRRFYLEFVEGVMLDNAAVVRGRAAHKPTDAPADRKSRRGDDTAAAIEFDDTVLAIHGKADWVESSPEGLVVVEKKLGSGPPDAAAWPNDKVQAAAMALALANSGHTVAPKVVVFYQATSARVEVPLDDDLRDEVASVIADARSVAGAPCAPAPPADIEKKCVPCSLHPLCLPYEVSSASAPGSVGPGGLVPSGADMPLTAYIDSPGAYIAQRAEHIEVRTRDGETTRIPLQSTGQIVIAGPASVSTSALATLASLEIPVHLVDSHNRYKASLLPAPAKTVALRQAQFRNFSSPSLALALARAVVSAKVANQRLSLLRFARNHREKEVPLLDAIRSLRRLSRSLSRADSTDSLRGFEGTAARDYFAAWTNITPPEVGAWEGRSRRPPKDPLNACLSFAYSLLAKELFSACMIAGLDPYFGFYHADRFGRPSLALDLLEAFRPVIADSVVWTLFNNNRLAQSDFLSYHGACYLTESGRKAFYTAYEQRLADEVKHPIFRYRISYRRALELEARSLAAFLRGDFKAFKPFRAR